MKDKVAVASKDAAKFFPNVPLCKQYRNNAATRLEASTIDQRAALLLWRQAVLLDVLLCTNTT